MTMTKIYIAVETAHDTPVAAHAFTLREVADAVAASSGEVYECELDDIPASIARSVIGVLRRRIEEATEERSHADARMRILHEALRAAQSVNTDEGVDHG